MRLQDFDDLLALARQQSEPQRLLLVFTQAEAGPHGQALQPLMCVDKDPHQLADFAALCAEAAQAGPPWALLFAAALAGNAGNAPAEAQIEAGLKAMVAGIQGGQVQAYLAFDGDGQAVQLSRA